MANPNIVNVSDIRGKSTAVALTTTEQTLISNPASSGKVYKINVISVANIDGGNNEDVSINYYTEDDLGGSDFAIASTIKVPANGSLVVIDKNTSIYLEEDKSIGGLATGNSDLVAFVSYEEIS